MRPERRATEVARRWQGDAVDSAGESSGSCAAQSSSWRSGENSSAGSPAAIQPIGTTVPGASREFTWRTLRIRSSDAVPATEPGNIETPVATKTSSSTMVPLRWVCGPTSTASPIVTGWSARPRSSACSITTTSAPIRIGPRSPLSTAPASTRVPARASRRP